MYHLISFDMDGTLTASKSPLDHEMSLLLKQLLSTYHVAIISGGDFPQFQKQFLPYLTFSEEEYKKMYILPTCGTKFFTYQNTGFANLYEDPIPEEDKIAIRLALQEVYTASGFMPSHVYGDIIEDRHTQITFSALGQDAPLDQKEQRDPTKQKRQFLIDQIANKFPSYSFNFGGTTSIDITKLGIDKSYGMQKLMEFTNLQKESIVFVGDRLEPGGNDYPVKHMGIHSIATTGPEYTKHIIRTQFLTH